MGVRRALPIHALYPLHLQHVSLLGDHFVQHRIDKKPRKSREISPATMTIANGFCVSDPMPVESTAGKRPRQATSAVIMIGRNRSSEASRVAVRMSLFSRRSLLMYETRITAVSTDTPMSASIP